jgi:hypothetical protein
VTPPDKPGRTDQGAEADHTAAVATSGPAQQVDQAAGGNHEGNGLKPPATAHVAGAEDLELSHGTPPPWQRVQPEKPTQPTAAPSAPTPPPGSGEKTIRVERPVVTGTAAASLFGGSEAQTVNVPHSPPVPPRINTPPGGIQMPSAARTTVNLDGTSGSPSSTGPLRAVGVGAAAPSALRRPGRGPRRANLQIKRFDPWSVLKLSLVLGVALFFVWLVAVGILYAVLDGMGVWDNLNGISDELLQGSNDTGTPLISAGRVFGVAAIIGAVNIVLFSALATVGAFIYNVSADLAGGLEVTLAERE